MKQKSILLIITLITIASFIGGASFAWFQPIVEGNDTAMANRIDSGTISLSYNGSAVISSDGLIPGQSSSVIFVVTNSGSLPVASYQIYFNRLSNTFTNSEMKYSLTCQKNDGSSCTGLAETSIPAKSGLAFTAGIIEPAISHIYTLTIKFIDTGSSQDYNRDKELSFVIGINDPPKAYLANGSITDEAFWNYKNDVYTMTFESEIDIPAGIPNDRKWDVSSTSSGEVWAYLDVNNLYIQSDVELYGLPDCSNLFKSFENLVTINNINLFNTSKVTNMESMFKYCFSLSSINLSSFNTAKVTNMMEMFIECRALATINLTSWQTFNVTNMSGMFRDLKVLTSINISTFDTRNVTTMDYMFEDCNILTSLDLSNFSTNNVTNMNNMFQGCFSLAELHIDKFNFTTVNNNGNYSQLFSDLAKDIASSTFYIDADQLLFINNRLIQFGIASKVTVVTV